MKPTHQLLLNLPLKSSYAPEDFVKSYCNQEAVEWIERWPDWPMKMLAIYGDPGCGKTHLGRIWQEKANAYPLTPADRKASTPFEVMQKSAAFVFDDSDLFFHGKERDRGAAEDWMFYFYNLAREKGACLLFCGSLPPSQWDIHLPDLRSRLATIPSVPIHPPDENALRAVLFKLCSEAGLVLSPDIADYILRRVERSFEGVRQVVKVLNDQTLSLHRQLTLSLVREVLKGESSPSS